LVPEKRVNSNAETPSGTKKEPANRSKRVGKQKEKKSKPHIKEGREAGKESSTEKLARLSTTHTDIKQRGRRQKGEEGGLGTIKPYSRRSTAAYTKS